MKRPKIRSDMRAVISDTFLGAFSPFPPKLMDFSISHSKNKKWKCQFIGLDGKGKGVSRKSAFRRTEALRTAYRCCLHQVSEKKSGPSGFEIPFPFFRSRRSVVCVITSL